MNEVLRSFGYKGNPVRTMEKDGAIWWVLVDVCKVLGLSNSRVTASRLDSDEVSQTYIVDARGRKQRTYIINESGLYSVLLRSDKPEAKPFKRWVTHEVLPSIRKTGQYISPKSAQPEKPKAKEQSPNREYMISLAEVLEAHRVFTEYVTSRIASTELPPKSPSYMSKEILLQCALAEVWQQGKLWHKNHAEKTPVQKLLGANFENVLA